MGIFMNIQHVQIIINQLGHFCLVNFSPNETLIASPCPYQTSWVLEIEINSNMQDFSLHQKIFRCSLTRFLMPIYKQQQMTIHGHRGPFKKSKIILYIFLCPYILWSISVYLRPFHLQNWDLELWSQTCKILEDIIMNLADLKGLAF